MKAHDFVGEDYYIQTSDVELLHELVLSLRLNPFIVNIGAGLGTSTLAMLECREDSFVCSIDIRICFNEYSMLGLGS